LKLRDELAQPLPVVRSGERAAGRPDDAAPSASFMSDAGMLWITPIGRHDIDVGQTTIFTKYIKA
jgi:hypothetical protein